MSAKTLQRHSKGPVGSTARPQYTVALALQSRCGRFKFGPPKMPPLRHMLDSADAPDVARQITLHLSLEEGSAALVLTISL